MFSSFFTALFIPGDKQSEARRYKINWIWIFLTIPILAGIIYFVFSMYYQVFWVKQDFNRLDDLNRKNFERKDIINYYLERSIDSYIEFDRLEMMHQGLLSYIYDPYKSNNSINNELELLKIAKDKGLLAAIDADYVEGVKNYKYNKFDDYLKEPHNPKEITPRLWPVKGFVVGEFGSIGNQFLGSGDQSIGILLGTKKGGSVVASANGVVFDAGISGAQGGVVEIFHGLGFVSRYSNLKNIVVKQGDRVKGGQKLATAHARPGLGISYLYYQIFLYGIPQDPAVYIF
ncbi:MAG: M23 family metallopeptidase [SAR324 cluster bacterium]|nr:M23 family metallopeptidase [SAR324 cluster bacterium]